MDRNRTTSQSKADILLDWQEPPGYQRAGEVEKAMRAALTANMTESCWEIWRSELPYSVRNRFEKAVSQAVRRTVRFLVALNPEGCLLWPAKCWFEPPISAREPNLATHELECLRLLASIIAQAVRNGVENLHAEYQTSDARMPLFNRTARNCAYEVLLAHPYEAWRLSWHIQCYFRAEARGELQIPVNPGLLGRT